jgi:hypothetical protein
MENSGKTFTQATETIDGKHYVDCRFENCKLIYRGGGIPRITGCHFENCQWQFEDAAERTLLFMRQLYHGMGAGGAQLVEATLAQLRQPITQAQVPGQQPAQPSQPPPPSTPPLD